MKDLNVIKDAILRPYRPGDEGEPSILIVRNKDTNGRRVGIFTQYGNAIAGQPLNHADALHEPKSVTPVPQGYTSGTEVNLSAKRNYYKFGTYRYGEMFIQHHANMKWFAGDAVIEAGKLKVNPWTKDLTRYRTTLNSGDGSVSANVAELKKNSFCSFTLVFAGTPYHIGLDMANHPAFITAELNIRLNRIHPQLRGFVSVAEGSGLTAVDFYIAPPEGLDVTIPLTTFPTKNDLSPTFAELGTGQGVGTYHLNKGLTSALLIDNTNGVRDTINTVSAVSSATKKTVDQHIADAFTVNLNAFTHEVATPTLYTGRVTIPASAFASYDADQRLNFAVLKLQRQYDEGRVFRLLNIRYKTADGSAIAFEDQFADLLVMPVTGDVDPAGSVYLDELNAGEVDRLIGLYHPTPEAIKFAESGVLNEETAMYVAVFPTPTPDNRSSIFFRESVNATYLEIEYELVEADVIPTVKMDDLGTLDYHYIQTEEHAFRPVSFTTTPVHKWNLEFITEGQTQRYQGLNHGPVEGSTDIHLATQGTVGEAVILAGIDYSKVKAPTEGEPLYFYTGEIGAESWLYQNLPYVDVVTTRVVTALKSKYKVIFPDVAMDGTLEGIEEPLIAKQQDGSLVISGRFSNPAYSKNVFFHSTNTTWTFNLKGTNIVPTEPLVFDPLTGEFSARFAVDDLVEPGPGTHVFRVTAVAKYPWLTQQTTYSQTMNVVVLPAVEGIEDDVTFIGTNLFDKPVDGTENSGYRLVDLDTGEILATGSNVFALKEDATTRGLVDINLIYGEVFEEPVEISCEGAPTSVELDIEGEWDLEIEGEVVGSGTMNELKPLALAQDVQIITECQPSTVEVEDKLLTYNDSDMLCVAYQIDDGPVLTEVIDAPTFRLTMGAQSFYDPNAPEYPTFYSTTPFLRNVYELGKYVNFENVDEGYRNIAETSAPCINGEVYITRKRIWMSPLRAADWMGVDGQTLKLSLEFNGATHVVETPVNTEQNWDFVTVGYLEEKRLYQELATQLSAIPGLVAEAGEGHIATHIVGDDEIPYRWVLMLSYDQSAGLEIDLNTANNIPAPSGRNTAWVEGHPEYQSTMCKLGLVPASEFVNGKFTITGKPKLGPNLIPGNHQIVIGSFAEFGLELPPNGIDYMVVNNIPKLEIHSCSKEGGGVG